MTLKMFLYSNFIYIVTHHFDVHTTHITYNTQNNLNSETHILYYVSTLNIFNVFSNIISN